MAVQINAGKSYPKMTYFSKTWLKALWHGERPLWEAWWVFGIGTTLVCYGIAFLGAFLFRSTIVESFLGLWGIVMIIAQIFWWVTAWKCAHNTENVFWFYLARTLIVLAPFKVLYEAFAS